MSELETILKMPEPTDVDKSMQTGRSKNHRLLQIEKRASEAIFISDHYNEEDKGIVKESRALLRRKPGKTEKEQMLDMVEIKDSLIRNEGNKDRENLIVETLPELREGLSEVPTTYS